jgi:hypothetical protein
VSTAPGPARTAFGNSLPVTPIPLMIVMLAIAGTTVGLWISQTMGLVDQCNVYLDGCISISAAGRYPPAVHVFHATIIPHGTLLFLVWPLTVMWLRALGAGSRAMRATILFLGGLSPVFLIYYVVGLGQSGVWIDTSRLIIIRFFFVMTLIAQILTSLALLSHARTAGTGGGVPRRLAIALLAVALGTFCVAASSVPIHFALVDPSVPLNLMQWYASTVYLVWFLLLWVAWHRSGFCHIAWSSAATATPSHADTPARRIATGAGTMRVS